MLSENSQKEIWAAVGNLMTKKLINAGFLSRYTLYMPERIKRGLTDGTEPITSDFLHRCVLVFGLTTARDRGTLDYLSDEECAELLLSHL